MADDLSEPLQSFKALTPAMSSLVGQTDVLQGRYAKLSRAGEILPNVVEALRVEATYHSNAIEGNTLSLRETQLVIEGRAPGGDRPIRELYEARNHDQALRMIEAWAQQRPADSQLSQYDVLDVHARVLADIDPLGAGRFRTGRVLIAGTGFVPPGSHRFNEIIPIMLDLANGTGLHPVLRAAEFHYNLVAIHPFADGNGRTARLMMNYLLLRHSFPLTIIEVNRRSEYLAALDEANQGSTEHFARLIAECVIHTLHRFLGDEAGAK